MDKLVQGLVRAVPRERAARVLQADPLLEDADRRLRQRQEELHGLHEVAAGLDAAQGLDADTGARSAPPHRRRALAPPWLQARLLAALRRRSLAFVARLHRGARRAVRLGVLDGRPVHGADDPQLDARQLPRSSGTSRPTATSRCRTISIAAAVTVTDAIIAFPFAYFMARLASPRMRGVLFVLVLLPLWASYLARVYAWRLILNSDGLLNWTLAQARAAGPANIALHEHRDVDRLLVHLAAVHDPAGLRGARAHPPLLHRGLARPRREGLRGRCARVILPLALPGIVAGSIFTFSLTLGDYITPVLVGGASSQFIGNVVYDSVNQSSQPAVRGRVRRRAARGHGRLPADRAPARRVRGAL